MCSVRGILLVFIRVRDGLILVFGVCVRWGLSWCCFGTWYGFVRVRDRVVRSLF